MKLIALFRSLVSGLFQRSRTEREMDDELRAHLQLRADDLERTGISRREAERRARIEFGGYERFKEESHEELGGTSSPRPCKMCASVCAHYGNRQASRW